jgi:hypothetical protein
MKSKVFIWIGSTLQEIDLVLIELMIFHEF